MNMRKMIGLAVAVVAMVAVVALAWEPAITPEKVSIPAGGLNIAGTAVTATAAKLNKSTLAVTNATAATVLTGSVVTQIIAYCSGTNAAGLNEFTTITNFAVPTVPTAVTTMTLQR